MFTSILGYGPGSENLELWIRIRQKFRILADPDPQHCLCSNPGSGSGFFSEVGSGQNRPDPPTLLKTVTFIFFAGFSGADQTEVN
jgi:hypothetical protein